MKSPLKKLIYFMLIGVLLMSCDTNDTLSVADRNVVSEDGSIAFEELLLLINIKTPDNKYLVINSVDSVSIYVNNNYWSKISSQPLDITKIEKQTVGNQYLAEKKINYLVIAGHQVEQPDYNTAGDFAQYLNAVYDLQPGEYACLIESFQVTFNDNTVKTYYPFQYATFRVEQNSRSAFVGEIEIKID